MSKILLGNLIRSAIELIFALSFLMILFYICFVNPFELVSDTLNYYHHYQERNIFTFGFEFITPLLFFIFDFFSIDFYIFVFVLGVFHFYVFLKLSRELSLLLLPIYFAFIIFYLQPGYFFLLRQYLAFSFIILYSISSSRFSYVFLFLAVFSHLSAIIFIFFMFLKVNKKSGLLVVFLLLLSLLGFSFLEVFLSLLEKVSVFLNQFDLNRKVRGMLEQAESSKSSGVILLILCVSLLIHAFLLTEAVNTRLLSLFFYSSCVVLMFQDSVVIANRIGFPAYFFSIVYFVFLLSSLRVTKNFRIRVINNAQ